MFGRVSYRVSLAADNSQPIFVDLRSVYPPEDVEEAGLRWFGIGRPPRG